MSELKELTMPEVIKEINRLAKIKKERELNAKESAYREELKVLYLKYFRSGFEQQLKSTKVIDANGNDVTPSKLKKEGEKHDKQK
ncbi:hypothetical protein MENTO_v1c03630 [Mesoplasma entomophilum]|uniref:DUF896 family protein n=1 Tax=Mesoplasma entomophilum TaxID=2149 RepID=A0A3S5Y024_9MOLU|nr:DUF896 domain-containing protein [Mesoplasma entomophilum]ATQ35509.1 DUF896 family protein [Mesoplasma entomophilum]ATZ19469.1 hypothetical protein MENTO_v1c03630 [Mesoplasma entomophilum]